MTAVDLAPVTAVTLADLPAPDETTCRRLLALLAPAGGDSDAA